MFTNAMVVVLIDLSSMTILTARMAVAEIQLNISQFIDKMEVNRQNSFDCGNKILQHLLVFPEFQEALIRFNAFLLHPTK